MPFDLSCHGDGDRDPALAAHGRSLLLQRIAAAKARPTAGSTVFPGLADGARAITDGQGGLLLDAYSATSSCSSRSGSGSR
ncbi:hypothetical protein [Actinoplanes sp. NPDC051411]|uniref:hypothetical protein n=1 Tax=Actinoplanes sp. NPDC051411 TaxID=3155522 RepID=UPI00343D73BB